MSYKLWRVAYTPIQKMSARLKQLVAYEPVA